MKPLLLMDVDGVLVPFNFLHYTAFDGSTPFNDSKWTPGNGYLLDPDTGLFYAPKNGEHIRMLMEHFDVNWATGWGHRANHVISPLHDLPYFPVVDRYANASAEELRSCLPHWKGLGITRHVGDQPFAFVDDDIDHWCHDWAKDRTDAGIATLMVKTDPMIGFSDDHVQNLLSFANDLFKPKED